MATSPLLDELEDNSNGSSHKTPPGRKRTARRPVERRKLVLPAILVTLVVLLEALGERGSRAAEPVPMGVYRGPGCFMEPVVSSQGRDSYVSFVGNVDFVLDFLGVESWEHQQWPEWMATPHQLTGKPAIIGTTLAWPGDWHRKFDDDADPSTPPVEMGWSVAARGGYDVHWRALGERLVATGQGAAILRGAHEFNGGWFPWRVEEEEIEDFVAAWRRWVDVLRNVPGQSFTFSWNVAVGEMNLSAAERAYPGDDVVDHIAIDIYDGWYERGWRPGIDPPPTEEERDAMWEELYSGDHGLLFWKEFSARHDKPLAFPEWGLQLWADAEGVVHGGGDNPRFIARMAAIINDPEWDVAYHAFWEDPGMGVSDPDEGRAIPVPRSRGAFIRHFLRAEESQAPDALRMEETDCSGTYAGKDR